ncbi:T9SS type A sorting domain-containing protein [Ignavibacterium album]|uniref:T9SS type A sorting domain-containing protein n=1 Tax=Ignavibacterium album TaxID=591197 RepID=UPI0026F0FAA2|nr:T9SS type A sorting domain-containing protein [Ignavibacterium album]
MIRASIFLLFLSSVSFSQFNNWTVTSTPVSANLRQIFALDSLNIWVSGDSGYVLYSSDMGNNWTIQNYNPDFQINDIYFINSNIGWAIENGIEDQFNVVNFILSTTNGGANWHSNRFRPDNVNLYSVCFLDSLRGIIGGDNSVLVITTNGGTEWMEVQRDSATFSHFPVRKIRFINDSVGFAVGGIFDRGGVIWHCTDGGFNWVTDSAYADPFFDLVFLDNQTIVTLASDIERSFPSAVFRSSDLGNTWFYQEIPFYGVSNGIDNRTTTEIWGTFGKEFIISLDRGLNWQTYGTPDSITVYDIAFTDSLHGFAVGQDGKFLIYNPNPISVESEVNRLNNLVYVYQNYPNPFNSSTRIKFQLSEESLVTISVYNSLGEKIQTLSHDKISKGFNEITFDSGDFSSGIYFCLIEVRNISKPANQTKLIQKMILLK